MSEIQEKSFGKVRSLLWPIHGYELKKIVPLLLMFFCVIFNYTILRDMKDALVVTAPGSGAEIIPNLKLFVVIPMAVIFMLAYAKLSNVLSKPKLFYTTISFFVGFFAVFAFVLYPMRELLHPTQFADWLQSHLPMGFSGFVAIIRNWTYALFYVMSELWGSVALSLVLWGFANDITRVTEAKRFYPLLGIGANIALPVSGPLIMYFSDLRTVLPAGVDAWGYTLNYLMAAVALSGAILMLTYAWMQKNVLTDPRLYDPNDQKKKKKDKPSMGLVESFKFLAQSKYLGALAIIVFAYGMSINLIEVSWKAQLKLQYPDPSSYLRFMGLFSTITGPLTIFMMLFVGGNLMRKKGWTFTALVTPFMLLITGGLFFSFIIFKTQMSAFTALLGVTPILLAVILGAIQNMLSKSTKYSLFDPTKEMAYIPLDQESKVKGKAAIDVVGARLGKSGGAAIQALVLIPLCGSALSIAPYAGMIMIGVVIAWIAAAKALGIRFGKLTKEQAEQKAKEAAAVEAASSAQAKPASKAAASTEKVSV